MRTIQSSFEVMVDQHVSTMVRIPNVCFIKTDTLYLVVTYIMCIRFNETDIRYCHFTKMALKSGSSKYCLVNAKQVGKC